MTGQLTFVVQKHNTKTPHFDFQLEIGKDMVSWVVPKGPTLDPNIKRLARLRSKKDHQEKYGEGSIETSDEGTYIAEVEVAKGVRKQIPDFKEGDQVMQEGLEKGEVKFILKGKELTGSFALVKTKNFPPGVKDGWLLIKHKDEYSKEGFDPKN